MDGTGPFIGIHENTVIMSFEKIYKAIFVKRINRFLMELNMNNTNILAHLHDPGRLEELLYPGNEIFIREAHGKKTDYSVTFIKNGDVYTFNDSRFHNKIASNFIRPGYISEVVVGNRRIDFKYNNAYIEVKSCTLVNYGVAMFPDAVSERASHHLDLLINLINKGYDAYVLFLIFNNNAKSFAPNFDRDIKFSNKFIDALKSGVKMRFLVFDTDLKNIYYKKEIYLDNSFINRFIK
ncbi:DNA/RNA nuclease SfsA [Acidiplasma aeolicum]|uniref:Sugar fermentation stimulation protein homolog n=2 Tax=Acidiplasma TaxID=507753 RepID=A0A0Q0RT69_9ARCH|nr:DNA/RNA nuclease SfsA [Acidiplasma aeolicum]KQB35576.1 hypothetical protein AOG54_00415 [Acidiplasma aeolicum]